MSLPLQQQNRNTTTTPYQPKWGDAFTPTNKNSNIHIIYQNPNGLSTSKSSEFSKTNNTIAPTSSLQPDTLVYSETNVFWGDTMMLHAMRGCFFEVHGLGPLQCAHNTHFFPSSNRVYPDTVPGGVCQWVNPSLMPRITHTDTEPLRMLCTSKDPRPRWSITYLNYCIQACHQQRPIFSHVPAQEGSWNR